MTRTFCEASRSNFHQPGRHHVTDCQVSKLGQQWALYEALLQRPDPVVVSSFMRSGTHLTLDFIRKNFENVGARKLPFERNDNVYLPIDCLMDGTWSRPRIQKVLRRSGILLCKTHWCDPDFNDIAKSAHAAIGLWLRQRARVILVRRDPRRTIDSIIIWHYVNGLLDEPAIPSMSWLRAKLAKLQCHYLSWLGTARPLYVSSSDRLLQSPAVIGSDLSRFLGLTPKSNSYSLPRQLRGIWHSRLNRMFATSPDSTEIVTIRPAPEIRWTRDQLAMLNEFSSVLDRAQSNRH